jgi:hypothetical protein
LGKLVTGPEIIAVSIRSRAVQRHRRNDSQDFQFDKLGHVAADAWTARFCLNALKTTFAKWLETSPW